MGLLRGNPKHLMFWCPGCDEPHAIRTDAGGWTWNGDHERPTFSPSVLVTDHAGSRCHSFVREGQIEFLTDSTHPMAGKTVPLGTWPDSYQVPEPTPKSKE
jgi:hypothetical protein